MAYLVTYKMGRNGTKRHTWKPPAKTLLEARKVANHIKNGRPGSNPRISKMR